MTAGLVVNPRSGGRNVKGLELVRMLSGDAAEVAVLERFEELPEALQRLARAGVKALFISSGDGTVQEIQTLLAEDAIFPEPPRLCLLPHGTTNMTAADLGFRHCGLRRQRDYILFRGWLAANAKSAMRPTLRIANPEDGRPRHGMFLGGGAIAEATIFCQRKFNERGVRGQWATFATLVTAVGKALFGKPDPEDKTRFDRPFPMTVRYDGKEVASGDQLAFLATTLKKLVLGARPFWGGGEGPVRASVFAYPPPFLPRWLPVVLYGGEDRRLPAGMTSFCAEEVEVETDSVFVLDGELLTAPRGEPLRIMRGADFTYLTG